MTTNSVNLVDELKSRLDCRELFARYWPNLADQNPTHSPFQKGDSLKITHDSITSRERGELDIFQVAAAGMRRTREEAIEALADEFGLTSADEETEEAPTVSFSVIVARKPAVLSKSFVMKDGVLVKEPGGDLFEGEVTRVGVSLAGFASLLKDAKPNQSFVYGVSVHDRATLATKAQLREEQTDPPTIARDRAHFAWPQGPGIFMVDYDPVEAPLPREQLLQALYEVWPELEQHPHIWTTSASSCIYSQEAGVELRGIQGQRVYVPLLDAEDIPRLGCVLFDRLWLAGHGRFAVSRSGGILARGLIDASVWQPERLDFVGGAQCGPGLKQLRPEPMFFNAGASIIDSRTIKDLTPDEARELSKLKQTAREAVKDEAATKRSAWLDERVTKAVEKVPEDKRPAEAKRIRETFARAVETRRLVGDFTLYSRDHGPVTVTQVLDDPGKYHDKRFADPLDPEGHDDRCAVAKLTGERPVIISFAQGVQFTLHRVEQPVAEGKASNAWTATAKRFPRIPFPWDILPPTLTESLHQLARSCATTTDHLPGAAFCILAAALGRSASVSPKQSWVEPLIIWHADIRGSGDGKTPPAQLLMKPIHTAQGAEHRRYTEARNRYEEQMERYKSMSKRDRTAAQRPEEPASERAYVTTDLTIEGIRNDLDEHPTGGIVCCMDELSAILSGQNQYKTKGNDREAWLQLHDGNPARVSRARGSFFIQGGRVSVFGGIQPGVFARSFQSDDGMYLIDGTIFRFLFSFEPACEIDLNGEAWSEANAILWERIIDAALSFADKTEGQVMLLTEEAQKLFFAWRNEANKAKRDFHPAFKGFLPKAYGYALRLTGVIHCLWAFSEDREPAKCLTGEDIQRGIDAVEFYLGQAVDAMRLFEDVNHKPEGHSNGECLSRLAVTLAGLRTKVDSGRLAVGFILECYNEGLPVEKQVKTAKAMGALLRSVPLTISSRRHRCNDRVTVHCVIWDSRVENFLNTLEQSPLCPQSPQTKQPHGSTGEDFKKQSPLSPRNTAIANSQPEDFEDFKNQCPHLQDRANAGREDIEDIEDFISNNEKNFSDDVEEF